MKDDHNSLWIPPREWNRHPLSRQDLGILQKRISERLIHRQRPAQWTWMEVIITEDESRFLWFWRNTQKMNTNRFPTLNARLCQGLRIKNAVSLFILSTFTVKTPAVCPLLCWASIQYIPIVYLRYMRSFLTRHQLNMHVMTKPIYHELYSLIIYSTH